MVIAERIVLHDRLSALARDEPTPSAPRAAKDAAGQGDTLIMSAFHRSLNHATKGGIGVQFRRARAS